MIVWDNERDGVLDLSDEDGEEDNGSIQPDSQQVEEVQRSQKPLREVSGNKRRLEAAPEERPPAKLRRTQASAFRAPTSLLQVKESVSFLLDEPHQFVTEPMEVEIGSGSDSDTDHASEHDDNGPDEVQAELDRQNDGGYAPDRELMPPPRTLLATWAVRRSWIWRRLLKASSTRASLEMPTTRLSGR